MVWGRMGVSLLNWFKSWAIFKLVLIHFIRSRFFLNWMIWQWLCYCGGAHGAVLFLMFWGSKGQNMEYSLLVFYSCKKLFVVVVPSIYFDWISSLPIGHFHTGFLIGIKLIQVRILYVIVDSGAIEIMFILIQSIKDLPKRLVKQQIPLQKNATWNLIKYIGIFRKYIFTTCIERELLSPFCDSK